MSRPLFYILSIAIIFLGNTNQLLGVVVVPVDATKTNKDSNNKNKPRIPIHALQKAIQYVTLTVSDDKEKLHTLQELDEGNIHTLYKIAKDMNRNANPDDTITSMELWHALADTGDHILSQVALGFAYAEHDPSRAVAYFVQAGENGPHQTALYNAGRLLAEQHEFVKSLAYLRAAYSLATSHPTYATDHVTETSRYAYERLSDQLVALVEESLVTKGSLLSIQQVGDMFLYANLNDFPLQSSKGEKIWQGAMKAMQSQKFELALTQLEKLEEQQQSNRMSPLQLKLLQVLKQYVKSASGVNAGDAEL
jgi:tetratricopeptide (TPR) repeat protein